MKKVVIAIAIGALGLSAALQAMAAGLTPQDYMEIEQLYAKYNDTIDHNDGEGYASTFTKDGVFNNNTGHDALAGFVKQWHEKMNGGTRRHWNNNLRLTGDGKSAKGSVYLMLVDIGTKPISIMTTASYSDELVKTADGWRFTKRTTARDAPPAPAAPVAPTAH